MPAETEVLFSGRRSLCLQIKPDGSLLVRAPIGTSKRTILAFLAEKENWIKEKTVAMCARNALAAALPVLDKAAIASLTENAREVLAPLVADIAGRMQLSYSRISVRCQTGRWGSCSSKGNISFNCLLLLCPPEVTEYVIIHELAHRRHMNHSPAFWQEVAKYCPDYAVRKQWLKQQGSLLIQRMKACSSP